MRKLIAAIQNGKCGLSSQSLPSTKRLTKSPVRAMVFAIVAYRAPSGSRMGISRPPAFTRIAGMSRGRNHFCSQASQSAVNRSMFNSANFKDRTEQGRVVAATALPINEDAGCTPPCQQPENSADKDIERKVFAHIDLGITHRRCPEPQPGPLFAAQAPDGQIPEGGETEMIRGMIGRHRIQAAAVHQAADHALNVGVVARP